MDPLKGQYLVDAQGHPKAVVLGLNDYKKLLKLVQDVREAQYIRRHQHEKLIPMHAVHKNLKKQDLV